MNSVIVTGASSGIGQQTALLLSSQGYFVILAGRNEQRLSETQQQLKIPNQSSIVASDLSSPEGCQSLIDHAKQIHKTTPLQCLINNAGIFHRQSFLETDPQVWESQFQTNIMSLVRLTRGLADTLSSVENSSIVNISSSLGIRSVAETSSYSAMKAAVISLTNTLALEFAPKIRVNCIAPGMTYTPIHDFYGHETKELMEQLNGIQPMGRMGKPEEIASGVAYLISEASAWTTGTTLKIDGGISL